MENLTKFDSDAWKKESSVEISTDLVFTASVNMRKPTRVAPVAISTLLFLPQSQNVFILQCQIMFRGFGKVLADSLGFTFTLCNKKLPNPVRYICDWQKLLYCARYPRVKKNSFHFCRSGTFNRNSFLQSLYAVLAIEMRKPPVMFGIKFPLILRKT